MMRKKCIYTLLAAALISVSPALAQDQSTPTPPQPPPAAQMVNRQISRLTTLLSLTAAQQTQAAAIFTDAHNSASGLFASMKAAHTALQTAVENNDTATITAQATQIGNLTTQEVETRAKADAAFYAILTPDQQAKYKQLRPMGPGGPGAFGRPGPGDAH
jgi:Spy/CpxP family protein refolding chaperone